MKSVLVFLYFLLLSHSSFGTVSSSDKLEHFLFYGKYNEGIQWIEKEKSKQPNQDLLSKYEGDFYKLKGDLEEALVHWKESNKIRSTRYAKNDYHLSWNYALLSNYYFEKIEIGLAKIYADSCYRLLGKLSISQQKEIEIHKIWNILAQTYKMYIGNTRSPEGVIRGYSRIRGFYSKSIDFITKHDLPEYYLAKTYHLIGNSYFDVIHKYLVKYTANPKMIIAFQEAIKNYKIANNVWTSTFGLRHHERAKTLYLMGMVHLVFPEKFLPNRLSSSSNYFDEAIAAFGIKTNAMKKDVLEKTPNKEDLLQCLRFANETLFKQINEEGKIQLLSECEKVSKQATALWEIVYREFKSNNTNQLLSIYNLIPFKDVIEIETTRKKFGLPFSIERLFFANDKLKYYDLKKNAKSTYSAQTNIYSIQRKLKNNEVFLDFLSNQQNYYFCIAIEKNKVSLLEINPQMPIFIDNFNNSIKNRDFDSYITYGTKLYFALFCDYPLNKKEKIFISPEGSLNSLAFEALLCSSKNSNHKDYRKLDYAIRNNQISYVLSPSFFRSKAVSVPFHVTVFSPTHQSGKYAELPFSEKLVEELEKQNNFYCFKGKNAIRHSFLSAKTPILHFSGHGEIDEKTSSFSSLIFSDSLLSLDQIVQRENPKLIVLNACNTSKGKILTGDGIHGFVRAYHANGTTASISNLWEVDDQASNALFSQFYKELDKTPTVAAALHQTKLYCIAKAPSSELAAPYYWAGHRLFGDVKILPQIKTPKTTILIWDLGVLGLVGLIFLFRFLSKSV